MSIIYKPTTAEHHLAIDWHSGGSSLLYALASSGNLSHGTQRPMTLEEGAWRYMTDLEWTRELVSGLSREVADVRRDIDGMQWAAGFDVTDKDWQNTLQIVLDWEEKLDAIVNEIDLEEGEQ